MSSSDNEEEPQGRIASRMRGVREGARRERHEPAELPPYDARHDERKPLAPLPAAKSTDPAPRSPDREELNALWQLSTAHEEHAPGRLGRLFSPLRAFLRRLVLFAVGPALARQERMNSAQVRFDNELVRYIDERLDAVNRHYDHVLGLHGKRMEEIDERHLILQQELIRHVHDLVERIEFVFESAEQNHLYLEAQLREARDELTRLVERLEQKEP